MCLFLDMEWATTPCRKGSLQNCEYHIFFKSKCLCQAMCLDIAKQGVCRWTQRHLRDIESDAIESLPGIWGLIYQ